MKRLILLSSLFILNLSLMSQDKPTLIYVGDPMCSWCYGFAPELSKSLEVLDNKVDLELLMGGLRPYNTQTMSELKSFLTHHWEDVSEASGQPFTYGILDDTSITYDTEPPSRAVIAVRKLNPAKELAFFKGAQSLFYQHNKNMHLVESYKELIEQLGLDFEAFKKLYESDEMKNTVRQDFVKSNELGIRGFPSIVLKKGDEYFLISNGYMKSEAIVKNINKLL